MGDGVGAPARRAALDVIQAEGEIVARRKLDETRTSRSIPVDQLAELWDERRVAYLAWAESRGEPVADLPRPFARHGGPKGTSGGPSVRARRAEATDLWTTADWHLTRAIKRVEGTRFFATLFPRNSGSSCTAAGLESRSDAPANASTGMQSSRTTRVRTFCALADKTSPTTQVELYMNIAAAPVGDPQSTHKPTPTPRRRGRRLRPRCKVDIQDLAAESRLGDAYRKLVSLSQGPSLAPCRPPSDRSTRHRRTSTTPRQSSCPALWPGHTREADILDPEILSRQLEAAETLGKWDDVISALYHGDQQLARGREEHRTVHYRRAARERQEKTTQRWCPRRSTTTSSSRVSTRAAATATPCPRPATLGRSDRRRPSPGNTPPTGFRRSLKPRA